MKKRSVGWGLTIFWLVIFWPVGLYFLFKKLAIDKSAVMSRHIGALSIVGWFLIVFGAVALWGYVSGEPGFDSDLASGMVVSLGSLVGGGVVLYKVSTTKKAAKKYQEYIRIVVNQDIRNIDDIASAVGLSYDETVKDLQNMIDYGFLKDAFIHRSNREIILVHYEAVSSLTPLPGAYGAAPQMIAVHCPSCDANQVAAVGSVIKCEYCGNSFNV